MSNAFWVFTPREGWHACGIIEELGGYLAARIKGPLQPTDDPYVFTTGEIRVLIHYGREAAKFGQPISPLELTTLRNKMASDGIASKIDRIWATMRQGDRLNNEDLVLACRFFEDLAVRMAGVDFLYLAFAEVNRRAVELRGWVNARNLQRLV